VNALYERDGVVWWCCRCRRAGMAGERWCRAELPRHVAAFAVRDDGRIW
jgi:hypothetical protein